MKGFLTGCLGSVVVALALLVPLYTSANEGVPSSDSSQPSASVIEQKDAQRRCFLGLAFFPAKWIFGSAKRAISYLHTTHPKKFYSVLALAAVGSVAGAAYYVAKNYDLSEWIDLDKDESQDEPVDEDSRETDEFCGTVI